MEIMSLSNLCESLISPDETKHLGKCRDSASGWLIFLLSASLTQYILLNNFSIDKLQLTSRTVYIYIKE